MTPRKPHPVEDRPQLPIPMPPPGWRDPREKEEESSAGEPKRGVIVIPIVEPEESP